MRVITIIRVVLAAAITIIIVTGFYGCAAVSPLQRKHLGDPVMQLNPDPMGKSLNNHIFERREGGAGGTDVTGGGCGC